MNSMTIEILDRGRNLAIIGNESKGFYRNRGILFGEYVNSGGAVEHDAWLISENVIVRWSDCGPLDFPPDMPFYSYTEERFVRNRTSFENIDHLRRLYYDRTVVADPEYQRSRKSDMVPIPVAQLFKVMDREFGGAGLEERIKHSRTIIKANDGFVFEKEIILRYDKDNGYFVLPALPHVKFYADRDRSNLIGGFKHNQMYRAVLIQETVPDREAIVDIRDEYFRGIEIALHEVTEGVYFPKSEREVIDLSVYPENRFYRYQFPIEPPIGGYRFQPMHFKTELLYYILKVYGGFSYLEMYLSTESRKRLAYLVSARSEDMARKGYPLIETLLGPIRPEIRGSEY